MAVTGGPQTNRGQTSGNGAPGTIEDVLGSVRAWPVDMRLSLVRHILAELEVELKPQAEHKNTLNKALGLARTNQPPPTDEEVEQWLDERRTHKYG
jgi:hypothetical protein